MEYNALVRNHILFLRVHTQITLHQMGSSSQLWARGGNKPLEFIWPIGIGIHPLNKKVYIVDSDNHSIHILNPDLTFFSTFGSCGDGNGQLRYPYPQRCLCNSSTLFSRFLRDLED